MGKSHGLDRVALAEPFVPECGPFRWARNGARRCQDGAAARVPWAEVG
jgi:hypothetical protein